MFYVYVYVFDLFFRWRPRRIKMAHRQERVNCVSIKPRPPPHPRADGFGQCVRRDLDAYMSRSIDVWSEPVITQALYASAEGQGDAASLAFAQFLQAHYGHIAPYQHKDPAAKSIPQVAHASLLRAKACDISFRLDAWQ